MPTMVRVGRLSVRAAQGGRLGQDTAARQCAQELLGDLDPSASGAADHSVLVVRQLRWRVDLMSPATARLALAEQRRAAIRPAITTAAGDGVAAVLFADEVELLTCLTRDALAGALGQWYWRLLVPERPGRIGAVLSAAWVERARWVPAVVGDLPMGVVVQAVSTMSAPEAMRVRWAVQAEFSGVGAPMGAAREGVVPNDSASTVGPAPLGAVSQLSVDADPAPVALSARSLEPLPRPWAGSVSAVAAAAALGPEQEALLGVVISLRSPAPLGRGTLFLEAVEAWVAAPSALADGPALPPADLSASVPELVEPGSPVPVGGGPREPAAPVARDRDRSPDRDLAAPLSGRGPAVDPAGAAAPELAEPWPADVAVSPWADGVPTAFASALYLVNLLPWLTVEDDASLSGWAIVEILARSLLTPEQAPGDDPLWVLLAGWDGREAEEQPLVTFSPECPPGLREQAAQLLTDHEVDIAALAQPGRITATRTHIDVVLNLERIDMAVRVCGLDRDPGWVPELGRIIAFHFEGGT